MKNRLTILKLALIAILFAFIASCVTVGEYTCYDRAIQLSQDFEQNGYKTDIAFGRVRGQAHCVMLFSEDGIQWHRYTWHSYDKTMQAEFHLHWKIAKYYDPHGESYRLLKELTLEEYCSIDGCTKKHCAKGLCTKHYQRMKKEERGYWL